MDIKQLIEDIKLRARNDRRVWAVMGLAVIALLLWGLSSDKSKPRRSRPGVEVESASNPAPSGNEAYEDLMKYVKDDINNTQAAVRMQQEAIDKLSKQGKENQEKFTGIIGEVVNRLEVLDEGLRKLETRQNEAPDISSQASAGAGSSMDNSGTSALANDVDALASYGFDNTVPPPPPVPPQLTKRTFISPGDAVPVRLLTGVAAPVDGTPYPVMFKLLGSINGPDGSALDLGEARIVAAAQGSETDGRVVYRLTDLAYRNPDGRRSVIKVDGWVVGEDGIRGTRGKVIDKLGQVILATMAYSGAASVGDAITQRYRNNFSDIGNNSDVTLTGNDIDMATASALTDGGIRITQLLLDKYEKLIPVVEVNSGRDVVAVFSRGAEVSIYDEEEDSGVRTASLD